GLTCPRTGILRRASGRTAGQPTPVDHVGGKSPPPPHGEGRAPGARGRPPRAGRGRGPRGGNRARSPGGPAAPTSATRAGGGAGRGARGRCSSPPHTRAA